MTETKQALDAVMALVEKWREPKSDDECTPYTIGKLYGRDACANDLDALLPALREQAEQLQAALGEAERDAERYRALRNEHVDSYIAVGKLESLDEQIDGAIDAMAAGEDAK